MTNVQIAKKKVVREGERYSTFRKRIVPCSTDLVVRKALLGHRFILGGSKGGYRLSDYAICVGTKGLSGAPDDQRRGRTTSPWEYHTYSAHVRTICERERERCAALTPREQCIQYSHALLLSTTRGGLMSYVRHAGVEVGNTSTAVRREIFDRGCPVTGNPAFGSRVLLCVLHVLHLTSTKNKVLPFCLCHRRGLLND